LASGSSDTNMKIWDIRKKRCIHTYKGHTRRIDVLKFTPDGKWIISGGADNSVKVKKFSMLEKCNGNTGS
jgi:katanin p80 WD40 repeat-containing subunit B1